MKKSTIITIVVLIFLVALSVTAVATDFFGLTATKKVGEIYDNAKKDETVVAVVGGKEIYKWQVDRQFDATKLSIETIKAQYTDEQIKELGLNIVEKTQEEILNELVIKQVLLNEAERQNIVVDFEHAKQTAKENFEIVKNKKDANYEAVMEYIKVNNLTDEEYIENLAEVYVKNAKIAKVKENYLASLEATEEEKEQKLNEYIAQLTQKETIKYE